MNSELFHIHTWRCKHASENRDEDYVNAAIELGAKSIVFTDHAPFPGNPFRNRMDFEQLPEYLESISKLKQEKCGCIDIKIGLEIEYFPSYIVYYEHLVKEEKLDFLLLGQHMYELESKQYSFRLDDKSQEYIGLGEAIIKGMDSGFFSVVAHPDRIFRNAGEWNQKLVEVSLGIIEAANRNGILLEINLNSIVRGYYRQEFWNLVPPEIVNNAKIGLDAHSVKDLYQLYRESFRYSKKSM